MLEWVPAGEAGERSLVPLVSPASPFPPLGWFFTSKAVNKAGQWWWSGDGLPYFSNCGATLTVHQAGIFTVLKNAETLL